MVKKSKIDCTKIDTEKIIPCLVISFDSNQSNVEMITIIIEF